MPGSDEYSDSPYASDWSFGAFAPPGVIWVGEIPLPRARELVDEGWTVVGQPLPAVDAMPASPSTWPPMPSEPPLPITSTAEPTEQPTLPPSTGGAPASSTPPPDTSQYGGPEEVAPPTDFDVPRTPLPSEPVNRPPATIPPPPPVEGEYIPRGPQPDPEAPRGVTIDQYPPRQRIPGSPKIPRGKRVRPIKNIPPRDIPAPPRAPPVEVPPILGRAGRVILGPIGGVIGGMIFPDDLGSGELPFPPIPKVDIPPPRVDFPEPQVPELEVPAPELSTPDVPDVIEVSAPAPNAPRAPAPRPAPVSPVTVPRLWPFLGGLILGSLAPRPRRPTRPEPANPPNFLDQPQPMPQPQPQPEPTTPAPTTTTEPPSFTDPLTPQAPEGVTFPQPGDAGTPFQPTTTDEDQCRCQKCKKCRRNKKRAQKLSDKLAHIEPFTRRISVYSLKNLRRGGIQQHLKRNP